MRSSKAASRGSRNSSFVASLRRDWGFLVKDTIGEWHDWEELVAIAKTKLDHRANCGLVHDLGKIGDSKYRNALALAKNMRAKFLRISPPFIPAPPDIRADFLTLPQAREILGKNPFWTKRLKGDLQMHTQWSDGSGSIEQIAQAAVIRGSEYIAITDHSQGLKIAGGIDEAQLLQQAVEIDHLNQMLARKVLFGLSAAGARLSAKSLPPFPRNQRYGAECSRRISPGDPPKGTSNQTCQGDNRQVPAERRLCCICSECSTGGHRG